MSDPDVQYLGKKTRTEDEEFHSQEEPGKSQCIGGLNRLLSNNEAVYAVSEVCSKGQKAQHSRWWHEHPGMFVKRHGGVIGPVEDRSQSAEIPPDVIAARRLFSYPIHMGLAAWIEHHCVS